MDLDLVWASWAQTRARLENQERYYFSGITSWTVSSALSLSIDYVHQWYLHVHSAPGNLAPAPTGEGWKDNGSYATVTASMEASKNGKLYRFYEWRDDASGNVTTSNPILMDSAKSATAKYQKVFQLFTHGPHTFTLDATAESDTLVKITVTQEDPGYYLTVVDTTNPGSVPSNWVAINGVVQIETNIPEASVSWPVEIRIFYTDAQISALNIQENILRIGYWNGTAWVDLTEKDPRDTTGVDTENNYVWAQVYHLSEFGPFGELLPPSVPGAAASVGGGIPSIPIGILPPDITWVMIGGLFVSELRSLFFHLGSLFEVRISAVDPANFGMKAWVSLSPSNGGELVYPMVSTFREYVRQEFSTAIDTSVLAVGNYTMRIYVEDTAGERDTYGPITFSLLGPVPPPPSPFAVLLASPAFMVGSALTIISVVGAAVWFHFYWKPTIEMPSIPEPEVIPTPIPTTVPPIAPPPLVPPPVPPSVPPSPLRRARLQRAAFRYLGEVPGVEGVPEAPISFREEVRLAPEEPVRLRERLERIPVTEEPREVRLQKATLRSLIEAPVTLGEARLKVGLPRATLEGFLERPIRLRKGAEEIPAKEEPRAARLRRAALKIHEEAREPERAD